MKILSYQLTSTVVVLTSVSKNGLDAGPGRVVLRQ